MLKQITQNAPSYVQVGTTYIGISEKEGSLSLLIEHESLATNYAILHLSPEKAKQLLNLLKTSLETLKNR